MSKRYRALTWHELANIYDKQTGGHARTRPMDSIFDWATARTDLFRLNPDGTLSLVERESANV